jgi:hypothetical protein
MRYFLTGYFIGLLIVLVVLVVTDLNAAEIDRALYISPQIKIGKMENGNGFMELQYLKFRYDFSNKYTLERRFIDWFYSASYKPSIF